jgi:GTP-binding protein HflX
VVVSARTGAGLADLLAAIEAALPRRDAEVSALVPYGRSDLIARAHQEGEVLAVAHCEEGTQLTARVPPDLAAQLAGASPGPAVSANTARSPRPADGG